MSGVKQTFKYRDPRETRLLNQASKDHFGRQWNHVLYGFPWRASGSNRNQIIIGRGAIYTQDGVKIFFDDTTAFEVPAIDPSQGLTGGPVGIIDFPYPKNIIIGIQHNFVASATAQEAKLVMIEVRTSQKDQEPAYYIKEINTITLEPMDQELVDPDRLAYNGLYDTRPNGVITTPERIATQKINNSIPNNVTPILRIRIQQIHSGGIATIPPYLFTSSGQLEEGVEIIRYKNIWQQVNDLLGVNVFEPIISSDQNSLGDLHYPTNARASQEFVKNTSTGGSLGVNDVGTPTQHPLFGSFDPTNANNFEAYRFSNFLMDGRSVLEGIKRLDAWMRLLVNRTGEQSMVDLTDSLTELQNVVNQGKASVGDDINYGSNFMLKNGKVYHIDPGAGGSYGDTHRRALHFLDNAVHYICNRLGMTPIMTRAEIEADSLSATELWTLPNPPGRDLTTNLNFHAAVQALRDNFTSRGNDIITGTHIYSLTETDRDGIPVGQKSVINNTQIQISDDVDYIQLTKRNIDSSNPRTDSINGVEKASLDSSSRYKVDIIASHTAPVTALHNGPVIEGNINAPQGVGTVGFGNIFGYTRNWTQAQLNQWANVTTGSVSHGDQGLVAAANTIFEPEIYQKIHVEPNSQMAYALTIDNLEANSNLIQVYVVWYDTSLALLSTSFIVNSSPANGAFATEGTVVIPANAKFFRLRFKNSGTANATGWYGVNFFRNRTDVHIRDNTTTTGGAVDILTRKDYVDAADAAEALARANAITNEANARIAADATKQPLIEVQGVNYTAPITGPTNADILGTSLKALIGSTYYYIPASLTACGVTCGCTCTGNCGCTCTGNCGCQYHCGSDCDCGGGMN